MLNNNYSQPTITYENLLLMISNLSEEKINKVVEQAKSLGISESYINQGLQIIKQIKNKN